MSSLSVWDHSPAKSDMSRYSCTLTGSDDKYQKYTQLHKLNNSRFGDYLHCIYPNELEVNDTTDNQTSASYLNIHLEIDNGGRFKTKLYDKRDDFTFPIVNFPFISRNIPASPAFGVYISQLIRYSRACAQYSDFLDDIVQLLTQRLLKQGYVPPKLKSSLHIFYGRHHNLVDRYEISISQMTLDGFFPYYCQDFDRTWLHIWVTRWVFYRKQELVTLREHRNSPPLFLVGSVLLFLLVFWVVLLCTFTFLVLSCDVRYDFHMGTLFDSFLSAVVCSRDHVLFTLIVFPYVLCFTLFVFVLVIKWKAKKNKKKNQKTHLTVWTIPKSNTKIVQKWKNRYKNTTAHFHGLLQALQ